MISRPAAPIALVIELYVQASNELFLAYGLTSGAGGRNAEASRANEKRYISILSATGDKIRLLSTLKVDESLLASIHPSGASELSQRQLEDWSRELNNQLMGRVKNKLLRVGCEIVTGLPSLIMGTDISAVSAPELDFREYFFASAEGRLGSTLEMKLAPDLELTDDPGREQVMHEGAHSLFDSEPAPPEPAR